MAKEHRHDDSTERDEFKERPCKEELMSPADREETLKLNRALSAEKESERILLRCLYVNKTEA